MRVTIVHDWLFTRRGGEACWEEIRALYPGAALAALFARAGKWPEEWRGLKVGTSAWNRLLQNNCTEGQFLTLLNDPNHTAHCEGSCIAGATDQPD